MNKLQHVRDGVVITRVDVEQNTLEGLVLVLVAVAVLGATRGSKTQELGKDEELFLEGRLGLGSGLVLGLGNQLGLLLLVLVRQGLLKLSEAGAVVLLELLGLSQLLFELGELALEGWLLLNRGLLVGIDDLERDELLEALVGMLGNLFLNLDKIGLRMG